VTDSGAHVKYSEDPMGFSEELVTEFSLGVSGTQTPKEEEDDQSNNTPDHVGLFNPFGRD
jgi:hypothetical protein